MARDLKIFTDNIEQEALEQINLLLEQEPFQKSKIRIMPDVHAGRGCVIGFTGNLGDKIIPNIVGVDIGCGMLTANLGNINLNFEELDKIIKKYLPSGHHIHDGRKTKFEKIKNLKCFRSLKDTKRFEKSIGTLGGGNHFVEVDVDNENNKYLVIHSGSRNLGSQVANCYQELANKLCNYNFAEYIEKQEKLIIDFKKKGKKHEIQGALKELKKRFYIGENKIPKDLAYLKGKYREDYLHDMQICQEFASLNRRIIAKIICDNINISCNDSFETIHNYIDLNNNIVRKGAVSAEKGKLLLIPINMRDGCIICKGKGNDDWNMSAPHGAGRLMSRTKAKEIFKIDDFENSMKGIYTTSISKNTIDEAPFVYKPMQEIIDKIGDTVEILKIIKPIYNFKATS
ncbi:MAG: RtcB family protein [Firmicutes bacterium]|nr:RtcB family protein [Bacillota bacterium]